MFRQQHERRGRSAFDGLAVIEDCTFISAEGGGGQWQANLKDWNRFLEIARCSALECAVFHDILSAFEATDAELNWGGETNLKQIVSISVTSVETRAFLCGRVE